MIRIKHLEGVKKTEKKYDFEVGNIINFELSQGCDQYVQCFTASCRKALQQVDYVEQRTGL